MARQDENAVVRAHPLVRVEPADSGRWLLSRDDRLRGHRVSALAAAIVVRAFAPIPVACITNVIPPEVSVGAIHEILDWLLAQEYLTDSSDDAAASTSAWLNDWNRNGWRAAARYHARTFGYPFEFYEADGSSAEDARRMVSYNAQQPDVERAKPRVVGARSTYAMPAPTAELGKAPFSMVVDGTAPVRELDRSGLVDLLALLSRPVRTAAMPYPEAAPVLRKTSPSGGSRHPTEFYVVTSGVAGLADGVYQVATLDGMLDSLDAVPVPRAGWLEIARMSWQEGPWALVIYSSLFERNRYRYREPRTFRTVHMDVGHLMTICEFVGRSNGWAVDQVQHLNGSAVALHLGLDRYVECPIAATFLSAPASGEPA